MKAARHPRALTPFAFTLAEMLLVVAILAVLAGLAWPAFNHALEKSRTAVCAANMKQIGTALFAYSSDHNGSIPPVSSGGWPISKDKDVWEYAIWTYAGYSEAAWNNTTSPVKANNTDRCPRGAVIRNIFRCPEIFNGSTAVPGTSQGVNSNRCSYGLNARPSIGSESNEAYVTPIRLSLIPTPAQTVLVVENSTRLGSFEGFRHWTGLIPHDGGSNLLFADGHVEWRRLKDIPDTRVVTGGYLFWNGRIPPNS